MCDAKDMVHDAILALPNDAVDSDVEKLLIAKIKNAYYKELSAVNTRVGLVAIEQPEETFTPQEDCMRQCKKCTSILHVDFFNKTYYGNDGPEAITYVCRDCNNKRRRSIPRYWRKDIARIKKFWEKEKAILSDKYIINRVLRRHFKKEEITPEMIREKRISLLQKKERKQQKENGIKIQSNYFKREVEEMTDAYIKRLIVRRNPIPKESITPEMIIERRNQLFLKRISHATTTTPTGI